MDVITELSPESGFTFQVVAEGGSEYIRKKVLRPILEGEQEILARGEATRSALTPENYEMVREEPAEDGLVRLFIKPKRQERTLIDGTLLVREGDADLGPDHRTACEEPVVLDEARGHHPHLRTRRRHSRAAQRRVRRTGPHCRAFGHDDDLPVRDGEPPTRRTRGDCP